MDCRTGTESYRETEELSENFRLRETGTELDRDTCAMEWESRASRSRAHEVEKYVRKMGNFIVYLINLKMFNSS